jgi:hypothetical protein
MFLRGLHVGPGRRFDAASTGADERVPQRAVDLPAPDPQPGPEPDDCARISIQSCVSPGSLHRCVLSPVAVVLAEQEAGRGEGVRAAS